MKLQINAWEMKILNSFKINWNSPIKSDCSACIVTIMLIVASLNISYNHLSGMGISLGNFVIVRKSVMVFQKNLRYRSLEHTENIVWDSSGLDWLD